MVLLELILLNQILLHISFLCIRAKFVILNVIKAIWCHFNPKLWIIRAVFLGIHGFHLCLILYGILLYSLVQRNGLLLRGDVTLIVCFHH